MSKILEKKKKRKKNEGKEEILLFRVWWRDIGKVMLWVLCNVTKNTMIGGGIGVAVSNCDTWSKRHPLVVRCIYMIASASVDWFVYISNSWSLSAWPTSSPSSGNFLFRVKLNCDYKSVLLMQTQLIRTIVSAYYFFFLINHATKSIDQSHTEM